MAPALAAATPGVEEGLLAGWLAAASEAFLASSVSVLGIGSIFYYIKLK